MEIRSDISKIYISFFISLSFSFAYLGFICLYLFISSLSLRFIAAFVFFIFVSFSILFRLNKFIFKVSFRDDYINYRLFLKRGKITKNNINLIRRRKGENEIFIRYMKENKKVKIKLSLRNLKTEDIVSLERGLRGSLGTKIKRK